MSCDAQAFGDFMTCDRCGLAWPASVSKPDCAPMTFARMAEAIEREAEAHEASHCVVAALKSVGVPADPLPALTRAAGLRSVVRLVRKVSGNDAVLRLLRG